MNDQQRAINELEEKVWKLRGRIATLAAALCIVSVFLAAAGLTAATTPEPKVVRATRFVLVDAQGKDVASFEAQRTGEDKGTTRLVMLPAAGGRSGAVISASPDGYVSLMVGRSDGPRVELSANPKSSGVTVWGKDKLEFTTAR
jgi:hypothetical protein